ncbi:MAG: NAD-dependent epimerase/dehydratase family protein [Planctomycetota bacterium]|nr:MAG: NAD-dependent epimerase/dehydratase family protein [Planctomycetota bacterium]
MSEGILITGVPGFIGSRLALRLRGRGRPLFLLCEPRFVEETRALARRLGELDATVVCGDITEPGLGLAKDDAERIRAEVGEVYHLAAVYDLAVPEDFARRVNVVGTRNVLDFLSGFGEGRVRHNYVSTCYVAGAREGMIFENELDRGQSFKNHYEATKFAAEVLVERSKASIETRIFRPAIVVGDSKTGETAKFDGPYPTFGAVMMGWLVVTPGPGRARPNIVPVDYIIDCLATIPERPDTAGKTFQLADPNPLTARELVELVAERLGAPRPRLRLPEAFFRPLFRVRKLVELSGITEEAFPYFNHYQVFDTTNTRSALSGTGVECPPLPAYLNQILRYYRERAELPWRFDSPP